jgi:hypothetical protein
MTLKLAEINRMLDAGMVLNAEQVEELRQIANTFFRLDSEAATHCESTICMRSHRFTGDPPYTGWKGLGLALKEDYDELHEIRKVLDMAKRLLHIIAEAPLSTDKDFHDRRLAARLLGLKENDNMVQQARNILGRDVLARGIVVHR